MQPEEILWEGKPSLLLYWLRYLLFIFLASSWLLLPEYITHFEIIHGLLIKHIAIGYSVFIILLAFIGILTLLCTKYQITEERIFIYSGILNRTREEIELYRVKDYEVYEPFYIRIFGLGNIVLNTSDRTAPICPLYALKNCYNISDLLRNLVEKLRPLKGVHEID